VPYYVGLQSLDDLELPRDRTFVVGSRGVSGRFRKLLLKYGGLAPGTVRRLRAVGVDLVHAQFGIDGIRGLSIADALGVPLIVHFRGYDATADDDALAANSRRGRLFVRRRAQLIQQARFFIAVSNFIGTRLLERSFPAEKLIVHYSGVDLAFWHPAPPSERRGQTIVFAGRLVEKKGCKHLLRSMAIAQRVEPQLELVIIGDGPLRPVLEHEAKQSVRATRFLGWQRPDVVRQWLRRATAVAVPSVQATSGDSEGLPNVVLEAQAVATPVVAFEHGGIPEGLVHEQTGFTVTEGDVAGLAECLIWLARDPQVGETLGWAGRRNVEQRFDLRKRTLILEQIYDRARADGYAPL
jgi:glycosyltransferase involved in cell wall biosynthesis